VVEDSTGKNTDNKSTVFIVLFVILAVVIFVIFAAIVVYALRRMSKGIV